MSRAEYENLSLSRDGSFLTVMFNRPSVKNALSLAMVEELEAVLHAVSPDRSVRAIILRGAGGHFCAGGDIKDMAKARQAKAGADGKILSLFLTGFGAVITALNHVPQTVVAVVEGAAGGGFGLLCVADVVIVNQMLNSIARDQFGASPAQIAPLVQRGAQSPSIGVD